MKILRIETCPDCKYGCHTQSGSYWWCTHPEIGDRHFDVKGIPDWCPLPDEAVEEMLEIMEKARRWNEWQQYPNLVVALINTFWKILNENEEYKSDALLRDALGVIIANDYDYKNKFVSVELVDKILALIEPELEKARLFEDTVGNKMFDIETLVDKARKWDKMKSLECEKCPSEKVCYEDEVQGTICPINMIVDALEGGEK
jgi:hypothetical protein